MLSFTGFANTKHIPECPDDLTDVIESTSLKVGKNEICRSESGKYVIYAVLDQSGKFSRLVAQDLSGKELGKSGTLKPPKLNLVAKRWIKYLDFAWKSIRSKSVNTID